MIVNIKLSFDDGLITDVLYHIESLKAKARPNTPGYAYLDFSGLKGKAKRTGHSQYKHRSPEQRSYSEPLKLNLG